MQTLASLPTFVRKIFEEYMIQQDISDYYSKYRLLEAAYATIVKYAGMTFALLAADHDDDLKQDVWGHILDSASLGGWVAAINAACQRLSGPQTQCEVRAYCNDYSAYGRHPQKGVLDEMADNLNSIVTKLDERGYVVEHTRSLNLIRVMELIVVLRNKVAHGAFTPIFFEQIEQPLLKTLKLLMTLVPFSKFVCWGRYAGRSMEFVERPTAKGHPSHEQLFWIESDLLSCPMSGEPFLIYREDARMFFFLNSAVSTDDPQGEYVDYVSGHVKYREVTRDWERVRRTAREVRPRNYQRHFQALSTKLAWREIPLTTPGQQSCSNEVGVYVFTTEVSLGGYPLDVVLYVGKTTNLRERVASYLRIFKKYDAKRSEISYMFDTYGRNLKLNFAAADKRRIASLERAIYEVTMPEYNILAPPLT